MDEVCIEKLTKNKIDLHIYVKNNKMFRYTMTM